MEYVRTLSHSSVLSRRENWPDLSFKKTQDGCIEGKNKAGHQEARRPLSWLRLETKQPQAMGRRWAIRKNQGYNSSVKRDLHLEHMAQVKDTLSHCGGFTGAM